TCTFLLLLLAACGGEPPLLPAAKLLQIVTSVQATIPFIASGSYGVGEALQLNLPAGKSYRDALALRVLLPEAPPKNTARGEGEAPALIIFSHGNWSDADRYEPLLSFWVSHGYAVLAPTHLDGRSMARGIFNSLRYGQLGLIEGRVNDIQRVLDSLGDIEQRSGQRFDRNRIALAGHSFGAFTVQQFAGAIASDEGQIVQVVDQRIRAVIALSPPGPMFDVIHAKSWLNMRGPVLVTTGTWDSNPQFWPDWRLHLMSYETAQAGDLYSLVIDGADHYLGNLICRPERKVEPQHDALRMINAVTVQFLSAYLNHDEAALGYIKSATLTQQTNGFAVLENR
ncbi:MAG: putative dienelactone hydrolase, partial [Bacteroidia bacterium]